LAQDADSSLVPDGGASAGRPRPKNGADDHSVVIEGLDQDDAPRPRAAEPVESPVLPQIAFPILEAPDSDISVLVDVNGRAVDAEV
jgi:hypothetical protein